MENELRSCREISIPIDVVDRERAEEALRAGEERYRGLIESTGDWVWEADQDFVLTYDSPMGRKILGYGPDDVIGKDPYSFVPKDELERIKSIAGPAMARHEPIQRMEIYLTKKDGGIATIETTAIPLFDESGRYRGYRGVNHDITERKRAEEAVIKSGEFLNNIFNCIQDGISILDMDLNIVRTNHVLEDWHSYMMPLVGKKCYYAYHTRDSPCPICPSIQAIKEKSMRSAIVPFSGETGQRGWLEIYAYPMIDEMGNVTGVVEHVRDISERKRAEAALKESEEKHRLIVETTNQGIGIIDAATMITFVNKRLAEMLGYSPDEMIGRSIWDFMDESGNDIVLEKIEDIRQDLSKSFEIKLTCKDGALIWVIVNAVPRYDKDGKFVGSLAMMTDITERKRIEAELHKSELKYRRIVETANEGIIILDAGIMITFVNKRLAEMLGYSPDEMIGRSLWDLMDEAGKATSIENMEKRRRGISESFEINMICKDCTPIWVIVNAVPHYDKDGKFAGSLAMMTDITKRKRAEAELETANRALRAISKCNEAVIHAKEESVLLNDVCKIIVGVGRYRMAWVGYAENDAKKSVRPVACSGFEDGYMAIVNVTWEDTERGRGPTGSTVRTGKPCVIRYAATDPNFLPWREDALKRGYNSVLGLPLVQDGYCLGALTIYSKKPDAFDEKEIILLQDLVENLTHGIISLRNQVKREEAERALRIAKQQAELYLDLMGHDINNMNQSAMGYLELALDTLESDGKIGLDGKLFIEKPLKAISNSSQLIENVGKLQRLMTEGIKTMPIDLHDVFEELKAHDFHAHGKDVTINYGRVPLCMVEGSELLGDVFFNLISNAIKHSGPGQPVTVDVSAESVDWEGQAFYRCTVEDDGPGIPDEMKPKVFHRFQRGKTKAHGKGLGLYIVRTLVEGYHGKVWVEDRVPGDYTQGARFVVMLPTIEK